MGIMGRLTLREIKASDASKIVEWRSEPEVYQFFKYPHAITKEEHLKWYYNSYLRDDKRIDFMAIVNDTNEPIGVFGIKHIADAGSVEVSYLLKRDAKGKGYAQEAVTMLISIAQEKWNCSKVIAEIHKNNLESINFIRKQDFVLEGQKQDFVLFGRKL